MSHTAEAKYHHTCLVYHAVYFSYVYYNYAIRVWFYLFPVLEGMCLQSQDYRVM